MLLHLTSSIAPTTAASRTVIPLGLIPQGASHVSMQSNFTYGSGGTTLTIWLQTSLDSGTTWTDVAVSSFTTSSLREVASFNLKTGIATAITATDGTSSGNQVFEGIVGDSLRLLVTSTGTYASSTAQIDLIIN